ncbi:MAG: hypothetical protein ABI624_08205 [Casimicrobiaceae bacterium]
MGAAGAALLVLLLVIGSGEDIARVAEETRSDAVHPAMVIPSSGAAANRKEVFDARRARFEGKGSAPEGS